MELLLLAMLYSSKTTSSAQLNLLGLILLLSIVFCFFFFGFVFVFVLNHCIPDWWLTLVSSSKRLMWVCLNMPCLLIGPLWEGVVVIVIILLWVLDILLLHEGDNLFFFFGLRQPNGLLTGLACIPWRFPYKYVTISGLRKQISHTENSESECL